VVKIFGSLLKQFWIHPLARSIDVNDAHSIAIHRKIIQSKPLLKATYRRWYREILMAHKEIENLTGDVIEIGSGAGFLDELIPELIKTDVAPNPFASKIVNAMNLDFRDEQLKAIYLIGVLHHISDPARFLAEAQRCLKPGGRLVIIDPNNSWTERALCKFLDHYEYFDDKINDWKNDSANHMTNANLAVTWVIFTRDRARFEAQFPQLHIRIIRHHTFLSYFLSGGMTYRSFLPSITTPLWEGFENILAPAMKILGTSMTIDIEKV